MTSIQELHECIEKIFYLFVLGQCLEVSRGMLRGPIKGLGLQTDLTIYCLFCQVILMPLCIYYFTFYINLKMDGLWISKLIVDLGLLISFLWVMFSADWQKIALDCLKR